MSTITDPVCGMQVDSESERNLEYAGKRYCFCSQHCVGKFSADPDKYINSVAPASTITTPFAGGYICPMHPEVHQATPGLCPKCGMALEPATLNVMEENPELDDMTRRFWIGTVLAVPVFVIAMAADMWMGFAPQMISFTHLQEVEFLLATPVVLWGGWPFFLRG
jgi:Cu+-exporting ATPase